MSSSRGWTSEAELLIRAVAEKQKRQRNRGNEPVTPAAFADRYWNDPAGFFRDILGAHLHDYQAEILMMLAERHRVAARGPHGMGKTFVLGGGAWWFTTTREARAVAQAAAGERPLDWKLISTASANRQLKLFLWPEIHRLSRFIRWELTGLSPFRPGKELLDMEIKGRHGLAVGTATEHGGLIEGAHAHQVAYWFDESKHIKDNVFDSAEGALSQAGVDGREAFAFAVSTPGPASGRFFQIHRRAAGLEDWWPRHVTLEEVIGAGLISRPWAEKKRKLWGEGSALYINRVLGEFAEEVADRKVILLADVERAILRGQDLLDELSPETAQMEDEARWRLVAAKHFGRYDALGVDVGKGGVGRDPATIARRVGNMILPLEVLPPAANTRDAEVELIGRVTSIVRAHGGRAVVDAIGAGAVCGILAENEVEVIPFVASGRSDATDDTGEMGFLNLRSEVWWKMRERLHDEDSDVILPNDDTLTQELTEPTFSVRSSGKIQIEAKEEIAERLEGREEREDEGGSTNRADAVITSWHEGSVTEVLTPLVKRKQRRL